MELKKGELTFFNWILKCAGSQWGFLKLQLCVLYSLCGLKDKFWTAWRQWSSFCLKQVKHNPFLTIHSNFHPGDQRPPIGDATQMDWSGRTSQKRTIMTSDRWIFSSGAVIQVLSGLTGGNWHLDTEWFSLNSKE